jgi:hypothetical protein
MKYGNVWRAVLLSLVAVFLIAPRASAVNVALLGSNSNANIAAFLTSKGHTVTNFDTTPPASYAGFDAVVLLRFQPAGADSTNLANFVTGGGLLITEWTGGNWAADVANLIDADVASFGFVGTGTPVTLTAAGLALGLGTGLSNPFSDGPRTEFFLTFSNIGGSVSVLGDRPGPVPAILGSDSGAGFVLVIWL